MSTISATPAKLRDGSWGARVTGPAMPGNIITIRTQAGKTWEAEIVSVLWTGDGVSLCATRSLDRRPGGASVRSSGCCRECRRPIRNAPHHRAMGGLCGECAFDEYDC